MDLAAFHPPIVHFTVALLVIGVLFRGLSFMPRLSFCGPTATILLLVGAGLAIAAVESGMDAHGPAEHIPGARGVVHHHEEWGERVRNLFIGVSLLEIAAIVLRKSARVRHWLLVASTAVGAVGLFALYEAAEHGGEVVYSYAGGVGTRTGDPADIERLLRAGLYHQARHDRKQGRHDESARLIEEMARRFSDDPEVRLLAAESLLLDRKDAPAALATLDAAPFDQDNRRLRIKSGLLRIDVLMALDRVDEAKAVLGSLREAFPGSRWLEAKARELSQKHG